jgi:hypothetical protein
MEVGKALATKILSNVGFHVEEIPVWNGRSADLRVTDEVSTYHIEVKEKFEALELAQERSARLASGDVYEQNDPIKPDTTISGILYDAWKQLDGTPKADGTFQLIWFHSHGIDADLKAEQAWASFYGEVKLMGLKPPQPKFASCFYFDYSAAFRMRTIEALVITEGTTLQICLNEFSNRANEFRKTKFFEEFQGRGGVVDPVALEESGKIIACRSATSRKNDDDVCEALRQQTGILYTPIRFTRHTCSVAVPPPRRISRSQDVG